VSLSAPSIQVHDDQRRGIGPITIAVGDWTLLVQHQLPLIYEHYRQSAALREEFDLADGGGALSFVAAGRHGDQSARLAVAQHFHPVGNGFEPGVALAPATNVLFIGAGERLLAYALEPAPRRLWEDGADTGFWRWAVHGSTVVMSAELELAAWDQDGTKLWSMFVEPPWSYGVVRGRVRLDIMGTKAGFPLRQGPGRG
jgi:hypothetical protein